MDYRFYDVVGCRYGIDNEVTIRVNGYILFVSKYNDKHALACCMSSNVAPEKRVKRAIANLPIRRFERKIYAGRMAWDLTLVQCKTLVAKLREWKEQTENPQL